MTAYGHNDIRHSPIALGYMRNLLFRTGVQGNLRNVRCCAGGLFVMWLAHRLLPGLSCAPKVARIGSFLRRKQGRTV